MAEIHTGFAVCFQNTEFSKVVQSFVNTSSVATTNIWQYGLCCETIRFILREHLVAYSTCGRHVFREGVLILLMTLYRRTYLCNFCPQEQEIKNIAL